MQWCKNLYVTEDVAAKKKKILHKMKKNKLQFSVYAITIPLGASGIMEVYPAYVLIQKIYRKQPVLVIGLAESREKAWELAGKIAMDCYEKNGDFDVRRYIKERQGDA